MYNWQRGWQTVEIVICGDKLQQSHRKYRNVIWLEWGQEKSHTVKCHAGETAEKNIAIRMCLIVVIIDGKEKPSEIKVLCSQSLGCLFCLLRARCKKQSLFFPPFGSVETHWMKVLVAQNRTLEKKIKSLGKKAQSSTAAGMWHQTAAGSFLKGRVARCASGSVLQRPKIPSRNEAELSSGLRGRKTKRGGECVFLTCASAGNSRRLESFFVSPAMRMR